MASVSTVTQKKPPELLEEKDVDPSLEKSIPDPRINHHQNHTSFDNQFFYEDEVFKIDKKGRVKFGVVTDNSEAFYSDEDSDDEALSKGEIRVLWHPDGKEEVLKEQAVRSLFL